MSQSSLPPVLTFKGRMKKHKKLLWGLGIALVLIVSVFFVSYKVSRHVITPSTRYQCQLRVEYGENTLRRSRIQEMKNDNTIRGTFFPASISSGTASNKTIIVVHGYTSNRLVKGRTPKLVEHFVPKGYNVLAFDLSSQGKSDGNLITLGLHEKYDLLGAVDYLKSRDHAGDHIGVIGFSMGAAT